MSDQAESWALIKQLYSEVMDMLGDDVENVNRFNDQQKEILRSKLSKMFDLSGSLDQGENKNVLDQDIELKMPSYVMNFKKEHYEPNFDALKNVYKQLDDVGYELKFTLFDGIPRPKVKDFLKTTLDNIYEDVDGRRTLKGRIYQRYTDELFEKRAFCFEPDEWIRRSENLNAIKTSFKNRSKNIPSETKNRINEAYSCFIHGHWLATQVLCRSILEAVIRDRAPALSIDLKPSGSREEKRLAQLIKEVSEKIPALEEAMGTIRENGNQSIHPNSKITKLPQGKEAKALGSIEAIVPVCEAIYSAAR